MALTNLSHLLNSNPPDVLQPQTLQLYKISNEKLDKSSSKKFFHDQTVAEILKSYTKETKEDVITRDSSNDIQEDSKYTYDGEGLVVFDSKAIIKKVTRGICETLTFEKQATIIRENIITQNMMKTFDKAPPNGKMYADLKTFFKISQFSNVPTYDTNHTLYVPGNDTILYFESRFECGNLRKAVKINDCEYNLILETDTEEHMQTQWFYFRVQNPKKMTVTFNILNFVKFDSLFSQGMKPLIYSDKEEKATGTQWHRDGFGIEYKENTISSNQQGSRSYYCLRFSYTFRHSQDTVYFAYSYPYTYSMMLHHVGQIEHNHPKIARVNQLCLTLGGNSCPLLTITSNIQTYTPYEEELHEWSLTAAGRRLIRIREAKMQKQAEATNRVTGREEHEKKQGIVITARVHPGETVGSFMMQGLIDFLAGDSREARILRKHFVFKIVPMLNPDGVRFGHYRSSLIGVDLNRRWKEPNRYLHPTIYYCKKMIEVFNERHKVTLFCDFHGHSRKRNVFMYGCCVKSSNMYDMRKNLLARMIPALLSRRTKLFSYKDSHFRMHKSKESSARIVVYKEFGIPNSYTMEATFYGPSSARALKKSPGSDLHMETRDFELVGRELARVCLSFINPGILYRKLRFTTSFLKGARNQKRKEESEEHQELKIGISKSCRELDLEASYEHVQIHPNTITDFSTPEMKNDSKILRKSRASLDLTHIEAEDKEKEDEGLDEMPEWEELQILENETEVRSSEEANILMAELWNEIKLDSIPEYSENSSDSDSCPSEEDNFEATFETHDKNTEKSKPKRAAKKPKRFSNKRSTFKQSDGHPEDLSIKERDSFGPHKKSVKQPLTLDKDIIPDMRHPKVQRNSSSPKRALKVPSSSRIKSKKSHRNKSEGSTAKIREQPMYLNGAKSPHETSININEIVIRSKRAMKRVKDSLVMLRRIKEKEEEGSSKNSRNISHHPFSHTSIPEEDSESLLSHDLYTHKARNGSQSALKSAQAGFYKFTRSNKDKFLNYVETSNINCDGTSMVLGGLDKEIGDTSPLGIFTEHPAPHLRAKFPVISNAWTTKNSKEMARNFANNTRFEISKNFNGCLGKVYK
jgi:hypothetical protein